MIHLSWPPLRQGRAIALAALVVLLLAPQAAGSSQILFGAAEDGFQSEPGEAFPIAQSLGLDVARITLKWSPGQTTLTSDDIQRLNGVVAAAGGIRIVVSVYGASNTFAPVDAAGRDQYCQFVRSMLARYAPIEDVVIWNEPNKQAFWKPQFNPDGTSAAPAAYEALLERCWDVLHDLRPSVNVLAPATAPRGNDKPDAVSNVSHSPGAFLRKMGDAYKASGRTLPILDTVAHHGYGLHAAERPWKKHGGSTISLSDWDKLMDAIRDGFDGTGQPVPGECSSYRCVEIWYTEAGFQTRIDDSKLSVYSGGETDTFAVPDYAGGEPDTPSPSADSLAPDQWTQIVDAVRLAACQPYVGAFINFHLWDEHDLGAWQSGPLWADRTPKDSLGGFQQAASEAASGVVDCAALKGNAPTGGDVTAPVAPTNLTALPRDRQVLLDWADAAEPDVAGFNVYRALSAGGPRSKVNSTLVAASAYNDTGLTNGTTHFYVVRAVDSAGNESESSAEASAKPRAPLVRNYQANGYRVVNGTIYNGRSNLSRLHQNDGNRVELTAVRVSGTYVAQLEPYARISEDPATLTSLTITYDGGVTSSSTSVSVLVYNWSTGVWETIDPPHAAGSTSDRTFSWTTGSPQQYVAPGNREIKIRAKGTRSSSFRHVSDFVRFSVQQP